jgi:hypothetical protein
MISESPVVTVHIPPPLRTYTGGYEEITASGDTVLEAIEAVCHEHPTIRPLLLAADGRLAEGVSLYLGSTSVAELQGLATPLALEELVSIVLSDVFLDFSALGQRQTWQAGPLDRIQQVFDQQTQLGITADLQLPIEEQGVGVFLTGEQLEVGGKMGGESQVGFTLRAKNRAEAAISIGE